MYRNCVEENVEVRTNVSTNDKGEVWILDYTSKLDVYKEKLSILWNYWKEKGEVGYRIEFSNEDRLDEVHWDTKKKVTEVRVKLTREAKKNLRHIGIEVDRNCKYLKISLFEKSGFNNRIEEFIELFLNYNSLHLLLNGNVNKYKRYICKLECFKEKLRSFNLKSDDFVIVSSGVLGIYGMRNPTDIDFVSIEKDYKKICDDIIDCHHHVIETYGLSIDEFVKNPNNYIYWGGIKFASLSSVHYACANRVQKTKKIDAQLIETITGDRKYKKGQICFWKVQHLYLRNMRELIKSNPTILKWINRKEDKGVAILLVPLKRIIYRYMYY